MTIVHTGALSPSRTREIWDAAQQKATVDLETLVIRVNEQLQRMIPSRVDQTDTGWSVTIGLERVMADKSFAGADDRLVPVYRSAGWHRVEVGREVPYVRLSMVDNALTVRLRDGSTFDVLPGKEDPDVVAMHILRNGAPRPTPDGDEHISPHFIAGVSVPARK